MALVEAPGVLDGDVHLVHLLQGEPEGVDGTTEHAGVANIKLGRGARGGRGVKRRGKVCWL